MKRKIQVMTTLLELLLLCTRAYVKTPEVPIGLQPTLQPTISAFITVSPT